MSFLQRIVGLNPETIAIVLAALVAAVAAVFTAWQAKSLRRQLKTQLGQEVQKDRLDAFKALWAATEIADPMREDGYYAGGPLSRAERVETSEQLKRWYYRESGDFQLAPSTRRLFLTVKKNLLCPEKNIEPMGVLAEIRESSSANSADDERSMLAIRQIELLRWVFKFDLEKFDLVEPNTEALRPKERELLESSGIRLDKQPFKGKWTPKSAPVKQESNS